MARCTLRNIAIHKPTRPSHTLADFFHVVNTDNAICPNLNLNSVMEGSDYMYNLVTALAVKQHIPKRMCQHFQQNVFILQTDHSHIYFRFLDYFSLFLSIKESGLKEGQYTIIQFPQSVLFNKKLQKTSSIEKTLFTGLIDLSNFAMYTPTCINTVHLVPHAYYTVPFRCKRDANLTPYCTQCSGEAYKKPYLEFRTLVLSSCGLSDVVTLRTRQMRSSKNIVFVSRTPLPRKKVTERIVVNKNSLINAIAQEIPSATVSVVHMEEMDICQQVKLAHKADILMGAHGAGLVHLWWLQDDAVLLEFEPDYKMDNPTFKVLSVLTGRKYEKVKLYDAPRVNLENNQHIEHVVNVKEVVEKLKYLIQS